MRTSQALILATGLLFSSYAWTLSVVDIHDRQLVRQLYDSVYLASNGIKAEWTGNVASCDAGTTSDEYNAAILQRINYFRSMSGVDANIKFNDDMNRKARAAALMMSANQALSHHPPDFWDCYSADGDEAAGQSNLGLGTHGYEAITLLMKDPGSNNSSVGHRRWIYFPQTKIMGTGDIVPSSFSPAFAHASIVQDENVFAARPSTRDGFVSWPPPGFVPYQLVFPRWSLSYANADFSEATVSMTNMQGDQIDVDIIFRSNPPSDKFISAPANTISWEPAVNADVVADGNDVEYNVVVENVVLNSVVQTFQYTVTAIDPSIMLAPISPVEPEPFLQVGEIAVDHHWQTLDVPQDLINPVLIAGVPTQNGIQPGVVQIQNESNQSDIKIRFREWNYLDKIHATESIAYLMVEEGVHQLSDGTVIQAGRFSISGTAQWNTILFADDFEDVPRVFVSLQSTHGIDTATLRIRNVNTDSFDASLIEQESMNTSGHTQEVAAYVAFFHPQNSGIIKINSSSTEIQYSIEQMQLNHRWSDVFGYSIKLEEEISRDKETFHTFENVDVLSIDNKLFAQIVSYIGADPVSLRRQ
jgi:uncharacterized protein YkwD